ncbi:sigma-70 family RNA polymerase sigma factor [Acidovorax sp. sic0104]|uniref:sigma-70 family RNA polymerase sigma factor n=1 Tax=Acidovorax sp. sic0104 TaxID=2854784 RepID=UPI001C45EA41|nr:sigma-70 family RNA polymerase sigma factor [Acidovorax sp. sic0104]MBV7539467.1 sigma-70 family RNA polymerase sigma factor [Acidovorax sp. sic0104]
MPPAAAASQEESLHSLYVAHHGWLQGWLRQRLDNRDEAADLAQDTFVNVISAGVAARIQEPRPFLATVARRLLIQQHRRRLLERAYLDTLAALPAELAPSPEQRLIALQSLQVLDHVLDCLPARAREVFLLAQLEGLTHAQISTRLGISLATLKRDLALALGRCFLLELAP